MNFSFFSEALIFFVTFFYQEKKVNGGKAFADEALETKYLILHSIFIIQYSSVLSNIGYEQATVCLLLFFLLLIQSAEAQEPSVEKVNNTNLSYVLNNIRSTHTAETAGFNVTVYVVSNKSGSAKQPAIHEVTDNIYIAVSEFDENPKQSLFVIKNLYAPGGFVLTKQPDHTVNLSFFHIEGKQRKKFEAIVKIDAVQAVKTEE